MPNSTNLPLQPRESALIETSETGAEWPARNLAAHCAR